MIEKYKMYILNRKRAMKDIKRIRRGLFWVGIESVPRDKTPPSHPTCLRPQHIFCSHKKMTKATENNTQGGKSPPQADSQLDSAVRELRMHE